MLFTLSDVVDQCATKSVVDLAGSLYSFLPDPTMKIAIVLLSFCLAALAPIDAVRAGKSIMAEAFEDDNESSRTLNARGAQSACMLSPEVLRGAPYTYLHKWVSLHVNGSGLSYGCTDDPLVWKLLSNPESRPPRTSNQSILSRVSSHEPKDRLLCRCSIHDVYPVCNCLLYTSPSPRD